MAHIQDLGTLKQVAGDDGSTTNTWSGAVSLAAVLEANPAANAAIQPALAALDGYMVVAESSAPTRCIDGRKSTSYRSEVPGSHKSGAQLTGGTGVVALAYRMAQPESANATFLQDLRHVVESLKRANLGIGDHIDDHHTPTDEDTGCGAVDKMPLIVERIVQPSAASQITMLAHSLLGKSYDVNLARRLTGRVAQFLPTAADYFGRTTDNHYAFKQQSVQILRELAPADPIEVLTGTRQEKGLMINTVPETTFNRDAFSADHQDIIQLFNYDAWFVPSVAQALFPKDLLAQQVFALFHVMYSLATAMVLTDGSLRLLTCGA